VAHAGSLGLTAHYHVLRKLEEYNTNFEGTYYRQTSIIYRQVVYRHTNIDRKTHTNNYTVYTIH